MKRARTHAAITDVSNGDEVLLLKTSAEQNARHHRNHVAEMRDWTNEALRQIAKVNIEISAARWSPRLGHVLRKDLTWLDALDEHRAEIANQRRDEVLRFERVGGADRGRFLAQRTKYAADDLRLPVKIDQPFFDESREFQVAINFEQLIGLERRFARTRQRFGIGFRRTVLSIDSHLKRLDMHRSEE